MLKETSISSCINNNNNNNNFIPVIFEYPLCVSAEVLGPSQQKSYVWSDFRSGSSS